MVILTKHYGLTKMPVRPLNEDLAEVARIQLNEDPTRLTESLSVLKEWIRKQPHLKARTDDQWLVAFLRNCKFSLERTKEKIDLYYSLRSTAPDLFCLNHTDPKVMDILDTGLALLLPKTQSSTAPRVILFQCKKFDHEKYNIMEIMSVGALMQQIYYIDDDSMMVNGVVAILDFQDTKLGQFIDITPLQIKQIITLNQDASPVRLKGVHFLNIPPFFEMFFNIGKSFLSEKTKTRLHVHNKNYDEFYKYVPKDILPKEFGGSDYTILEVKECLKSKFRQYQPWFEEDQKYGTVESLRSGSSNAAAMMFGIQGFFRRLEFD